jgi:uncharacterized protein YxjI
MTNTYQLTVFIQQIKIDHLTIKDAMGEHLMTISDSDEFIKIT